MSKNKEFAYDEVSYPSFVHAQTHPENLAIMAKFYGMKPKNVENCHVLEIGCGNGSNLISFAYDLPRSEFVGIDLSKKQIGHGTSIAKAIELDNIELVRASILDIDLSKYGYFDYVIAHGFYSWTSEPVRKHALEICRKHLAKHGVAFVSYNAFPGSHMREITRNIMLYRTRTEKLAETKIGQSMEFLSLLKRSIGARNGVFEKIVTEEIKRIHESPPNTLFHDDLEQINAPVYFHEFVKDAEQHDLQFLSEVDYFTTKDAHYSPNIQGVLHEFGEDRIVREQYIDFFINRKFRQTLLCQKEFELPIEPSVGALNEMSVIADIHPVAKFSDLAPQVNLEFSAKNGSKFEIDHPLTKAALIFLGSAHPQSVPFRSLLDKAKRLLRDSQGGDFVTESRDEQILAEVLMQLFGVGMSEFKLLEPRASKGINKRPIASKLARWQARSNFDEIINLRLESVKVEDPLMLKVLILLDGTRTIKHLTKELGTFDDRILADDSAGGDDLTFTIEEKIKKLAEMALLVKE